MFGELIFAEIPFSADSIPDEGFRNPWVIKCPADDSSVAIESTCAEWTDKDKSDCDDWLTEKTNCPVTKRC